MVWAFTSRLHQVFGIPQSRELFPEGPVSLGSGRYTNHNLRNAPAAKFKVSSLSPGPKLSTPNASIMNPIPPPIETRNVVMLLSKCHVWGPKEFGSPEPPLIRNRVEKAGSVSAGFSGKCFDY